jgi:hypothetical protein
MSKEDARIFFQKIEDFSVFVAKRPIFGLKMRAKAE